MIGFEWCLPLQTWDAHGDGESVPGMLPQLIALHFFPCNQL